MGWVSRFLLPVLVPVPGKKKTLVSKAYIPVIHLGKNIIFGLQPYIWHDCFANYSAETVSGPILQCISHYNIGGLIMLSKLWAERFGLQCFKTELMMKFILPSFAKQGNNGNYCAQFSKTGQILEIICPSFAKQGK